jgi:hypothetical protein
VNRLTTSETKVAESAAIPEIRTVSPFAPRWQGGRNVKKKIATLLVTVAMAGALFAGPALAYDHDGHGRSRWPDAQGWREHRPVYAYNHWHPGYWYAPVVHRPGWHWRFIGGHWRWVR